MSDATERLYTASFSAGLRVEARSIGPDGMPGKVIGGYAAVFGKRSHPMGGVREVVEPTFFNKSQADGWPMAVARFEHDKLMLLGTHASGTLALTVKPNEGLDYSVRLPEHRSDVFELAERGDLPGSSFSFQAFSDDWRLGAGGQPERHLVSGRLLDVAPTAIPAYPDSSLTVVYRSLAEFVDADPDDVIRDAVAGVELRRYFPDSAPVVLDMASKPTPLDVARRSTALVEARSAAPIGNGDLDIRRRQLDLRRKMMDAEMTPRQRAAQEYRARTADITTRQARSRLAEHKMEMESRSLDGIYAANSGPAGGPK